MARDDSPPKRPPALRDCPRERQRKEHTVVVGREGHTARGAGDEPVAAAWVFDATRPDARDRHHRDNHRERGWNVVLDVVRVANRKRGHGQECGGCKSNRNAEELPAQPIDGGHA